MPNAQDTCLWVDQEEKFLSRNYQLACSPEKAELPNSKSTSEKAHALTICLCSKECFSSPVNASHNFLQKITRSIKHRNNKPSDELSKKLRIFN